MMTIEEVTSILVEHHVLMCKELAKKEGKKVTAKKIKALSNSYRMYLELYGLYRNIFPFFSEHGSVCIQNIVGIPTLEQPIRKKGYMHSLYVKPESRKHGKAFELMKVACGWAKANGYTELFGATSPVSGKICKKLGWYEIRKMMRLEFRQEVK